jgi:hypothetical protein
MLETDVESRPDKEMATEAPPSNRKPDSKFTSLFWRGEWKEETRVPFWHNEFRETRRAVAKEWFKTSE